MGAAIKTRIVRIGNSQGIRISKPLLEQSGIHTEVEIEVHGDHLLVKVLGQISSDEQRVVLGILAEMFAE
ncbi:MAG: hypothetical protein KME40_18780 [Komarekiella atlantica HA4396-MV6]|jgi:antitoxin MazE|nr:hypothetical protein [Komarekiella atlantica HA4396-MV6]